MKINEVKIKGKVYEYSCGLGLMEWLGKELNTEDLGEIIAYFEDLNLNNKLNIKHFPKLAVLVRGAVLSGSNEDPGDVKDWCYSNAVSAIKVFTEFINNLPGQGESDKELVGNLEAAQEAAD